MATQTIEVEAIENETGTVLRAFQVGSDTEQANQSATEATNRKGCYVASFTDLPAAVYRFQLDDSAGAPLCVQYQNITDQTATFQAYESYSAGASTSEIADEVLKRSVSNVEATADQHSLATIILCLLESSRSSTTWTIKRTDGTTTHATKTLTLDATANPVIGVD